MKKYPTTAFDHHMAEGVDFESEEWDTGVNIAPMPTEVIRALGRDISEAMCCVSTVDILMLLSTGTCLYCAKDYRPTRNMGWLRRHYMKTGHWRQKAPCRHAQPR